MADYEEPAARYEGTDCLRLSVHRYCHQLTFLLEDRAYERRERSASPRGSRDEPGRSRSPNGRERP